VVVVVLIEWEGWLVWKRWRGDLWLMVNRVLGCFHRLPVLLGFGVEDDEGDALAGHGWLLVRIVR